MPEKAGVLFSRLDKLAAYERAVRAVGLEPVPISPDDPKPVDGLKGLVFTGGGDIDSAMYGEDPAPETRAPERGRDELEARLMREALDRDLPVLAICRGIQLLNVVRGGALIQHLPNAAEHLVRESGAQPAHAIDIVEGSRLASILGRLRHDVNSRHHQAVGRLGANLTVTARAGKVIEALEDPSKTFVLGVQWHPESSLENPIERRLFEAFRDAVNSR